MKENDFKKQLYAHCESMDKAIAGLGALLGTPQGAIYTKEIGLSARKCENSKMWAEHIIGKIERTEKEEEAVLAEQEATAKRAEDKAKEDKPAK